MKSKDIMDLLKVNFCISKLLQCNPGSCCVHITGSVNNILCQSIGLSVSFVCLSLCLISNQSTSKNRVICVIPSVNLIPCCIKTQHSSAGTTVPRLDKFWCIISLSKITH